ncbi:MAG: FtsQ-type POTRA domain-containing protein [Candidatus Omnitrophota bacterium]
MVKKSNVKIPAIVIIRLIVFLFIGCIFFWLYSRTVDFLTESVMFNVKDVLVDQSISFIDSRPLKALKAQNIFSVDLGKLHRQISSRYPQISQLRVERQLPDTIKVLAKKRDILLQVQALNKYLAVDTEGVTMFYTTEALSFPLVRGVSLNKDKIVMGTVSSIKELNLVVQLFKQLKSHPQSSRLKVVTVDVGNLSKIELMVLPNIQIIIDQEDLNAKLDRLEILFQNGKINWNLVKYIDVRFKEPIINEKTPEREK